MIPIRDYLKVSVSPFVTRAIIAINVAIFFYMLTLTEPELALFIDRYALIPANVMQGKDLYTLISSLFLHASLGHIIGNMLFLNIFGDNLEDRLGHLKFLLFYLSCGVVASLTQLVINPTSTIPNLGASGAVAGTMGGYLILYPLSPVDIVIPLLVVYPMVTVPAYLMLLIWVGSQFLYGLGSLEEFNVGGVAYFAHIGGFITGIILILLNRGRSQRLSLSRQ